MQGGIGDDDEPVSINVYWHILYRVDRFNRTIGNLTMKDVEASISVLNSDYASTNFQFQLADIDYFEINQPMDPDKRNFVRAVKRRLRKGGKTDLNIYSADLPQGLLGYATFPQDYIKSPELDGVVIFYNTVPGTDYTPMNLGRTLTHETGHWLVIPYFPQ